MILNYIEREHVTPLCLYMNDCTSFCFSIYHLKSWMNVYVYTLSYIRYYRKNFSCKRDGQ